MGRFYNKLKKRWGIQSSYQVGIILTVFAITGSSTVWVYDEIKSRIGIHDDTHLFWKILGFVVLALPLYNVLLLLWGHLLGQGRFFRKFVRNFFGRWWGKR